MLVENYPAVQFLLHLLRKVHLIDLPDYARFAVRSAECHASNKAFLRNNPEFIPPPAWRMYEAYAHCDYRTYFKVGRDIADFVVYLINKHSLAETLSILEWGCGPARVIRHVPTLLPTGTTRLAGADYNAESIKYCKNTLTDIDFVTNQLQPPIDFDDSTFDVIYAISVFTHLSENMHFAWISEIHRILKPGGIFISTFYGKNFKVKLLPDELSRFEAGELVVRGGTLEGSHMYSAYQPNWFLSKELFKDLEVLEKFDGVPGLTSQEVWVVRRCLS